MNEVEKSEVDIEKNINLIRYIEKTWLLNKNGNLPQSQIIKEQLKNDLKINDVLATLLLNRGLDTKEKAVRFLYGTLDDLYSPFLLQDMKKAVQRIKVAIENNEKIGFFTDFDCDGTTSNALFALAFMKILGYENIELYIPHREHEGYGLNCPAIQKLKDKGCSLIISADIGITAYKEAEYCNNIGVDLIITDHHLPKLPDNYNKNDSDQFKYLPQAYALVNPNRPDDAYPFKGICGCMVAFKLLNALWIELGRPTSELEYLIPIVAVATVADIVPLVDENRIIVKKGIEMMNRPEKTGIIGLDALIQVAGYNHIDGGSIGFGIGPRINACGRLESAMLASELLITDDKDFARERANQINQINQVRQEHTKKVIEEAYKFITEDYLKNNTALCLYVPDVHVGVVGIAAGQLTEKLYRPSLIATDHPEKKGYLTGSARSIKGIHILNVMLSCKDAFDSSDDNERFGGHSQAAGFTIKKENFEKLQNMIREYFIMNPIAKEDLKPKLMIDKALRLSEINGKLMEDIAFLSPYGEGNPEPIFGLKKAGSVIKFYKKNTLGICINVHNSPSLNGIAFQMQDKAKDLGLRDQISANLDLAFQPQWNEHAGRKTVQMVINDFRKSG